MINFLYKKKPSLTINQFNRISNIFDNAGQVVFGVAVISPMISGFDKVDLYVVASSIVVVILCWVFSTWLAKKG
jgi:hypothetical protein